MVELVGGQVLELQEDRWLKQGRAEGIEQGRTEGIEQGRAEGIEQGRLEGTKSLLFSLVIDKVLNVSDAAKRAGESEADFTKELETYIKSQKQKQTQNQ
jgi:flagellar biosynthesis/type III secretory pathway protein FliH